MVSHIACMLLLPGSQFYLLVSISWVSVQKDQAKIKSCLDSGQERLASIAFEDAASARIVD